MNPPAQAADEIAPAPQPVQVNVANAQDELEVNFGIPFFVLIGFSGCFAILVTYYGSGYDLCCVPASVFHGRITFVCSPVSMALLHIKGVVFSFPRDRIVSCNRGGFLSIFICGWNPCFLLFCHSSLGVDRYIAYFSFWCRVSRRYAPASGLFVVLCCFVLRRIRLTLKAVRSYGA